MAEKPAISRTPLPRKLGLVAAGEEAREIALLAAPEGWPACLGELPAGVRFTTRLTPKTKLAICFVRSVADLEAVTDLLEAQLGAGASAWIAHPKAAHKPGFNQNHVRDSGLARGLVDYKVCSIDADWSGLKFARRKT